MPRRFGPSTSSTVADTVVDRSVDPDLPPQSRSDLVARPAEPHGWQQRACVVLSNVAGMAAAEAARHARDDHGHRAGAGDPRAPSAAGELVGGRRCLIATRTGSWGLHSIETPDQWDEIRPAAPAAGSSCPSGEDSRRRWPSLLVAAATLMVVLGVAALLLREGDDLTTKPSDPGLTPPIDGPGGPSSTTQSPSSRPGKRRPPSSRRRPMRPSPGPSLALVSSSSPRAQTRQPGGRRPCSPAEEAFLGTRPPGVDPEFAGLLPRPDHRRQRVRGIAGLAGLQDDAFIPFPGPVEEAGTGGSRACDGGVVPGGGHPSHQHGGDCWITLEAIGMTQGRSDPVRAGPASELTAPPWFACPGSRPARVRHLMGSLIKKRRKRMRKKKHKKMLKRTRWQRRAAGK